RKLLAELEVAVDFAVEHEPARAVGREHRLIRRGAEIDDREAPKADADRTLEPQVARVGSTMRKRGERRRVVPAGLGSADEAAHVALALARRRASLQGRTLGRRIGRRNRSAAATSWSAVLRCAHVFPGRCALSMTVTIAHVNVARGYRGGERQTELLVR